MSFTPPALPSDFQVQGVSYSLSVDTTLMDLSITNSVVSSIDGNDINVDFQFSEPGSFGTLDSDTIESDVVIMVTAYCQLISDITGSTLASIQSSVGYNGLVIYWTFSSASTDAQIIYNQHIDYPPLT